MRNNLRADIDILRHILKYCCNIDSLIERFGNDFEIFKSDLAYKDAVSMNILQIGELTAHLSDEYRTATKERMPWSAMRAMRNLFAHNYGHMDIEVIWSTAIENIPQVRRFCEEQIKTSGSLINDSDGLIDDMNIEI